jgi:adenosylcobinamide-phosphate synthase
MSFEPGLAWLVMAVGLDLVAGEPPSVLHPVVWMGKTISALERLAPERGPKRQLVYGAFLAVALPCAFAGAAIALLGFLAPWPAAQWIVGAYLFKSTFAVRALWRAARNVRDCLGRGGLVEARQGLGHLCSRDPSRLDPPAIVAATVESVAENASDSVVAPLFYYVCFGLPGAIAYRVVNTLDAMIGYHGRYEYLGKAAARLDDVLNLIPARVTAALIVIGGALCGRDARRGLRVMWRDGGSTESPNAGRPMAAMAGVLGVELEKQGHYRLGDAVEALALPKIEEAWRVVALAITLAALLSALALGVQSA